MRTDMVRLESGVADIRFRPEFTDWWMDFDIVFDESMISRDLLVNMFNKGGFCCGLGENRPLPKKGASGHNGMFHVASEAEIKLLRSSSTKRARRKRTAA